MNTNSFARTLTALRLSALASIFTVSDSGPAVSSPALVSAAITRVTGLTVAQMDSSGELLGVARITVKNPEADPDRRAKAVTDVLLSSAASVVIALPWRSDTTVDQERSFALAISGRLAPLGVSLVDYVLVSACGSQRCSMASLGTA